MSTWFRPASSHTDNVRRRNNQQRRTSRRRIQKALESLERRVLLAADIGGDTLDTAAAIWSPVAEIPVDSRGAGSFLRTTDFDAYTLDDALFQSLLATAPLEFSEPANATEIALPNPDGSFDRFAVVESPVMAPELAALFPEIKTFAGQGVDDPAATLRFDVTPAGFHAQVLSPDGAWYIDPYYHLDDSLYASYFGSTVVGAGLEFIEHGLEEFEGVEEFAEEETAAADSNPAVNASADSDTSLPAGPSLQGRSGTQLRTYRTAVAATGEYTAFHGGTVASGQAAIVTAMNRVTGIYETELSVRLELVGNNNLLVYTNAGTDPYSNGNAGALLGENQANIDAVIGNTNYDLGHVFSTGGGGLAGLGVVGIDGLKAMGETGLPNPIGDVFYVDFVAHEIGHQFGGNHTFNGDSGNCSGGNRNGATAYEPGSGSTIQAYAGICGNDNLQNNSDPYFHSVSFDEIINHVDAVIPAVGTRTATGNNVPTVDAGNDYTVPARTPFALTASGNDADGGDVLTYNWEQRDLGPQQDVNAGDNGSSPLFRSFTPTTDPTRTFPRLSDLLNNTTVIGETLPTTTRTMNFRATVRDNRSGGGGVNTDDAVVSVFDTGAPFVVTSPNTAVSWTGSTSQTVTWDVAGTTAAPISAANVNILLSTDGGNTYPTVLVANTPNDGSQSVFVPDLPTATARIKVEGAGNIFFDVSNTNFTIEQGDNPINVLINDQLGVPEGSVASFTVSLSEPSTEDITLTIGTTDGTAVEPDDYLGPDAQVTIPAGSTTATATYNVTAVADNLFEGVTETFTVRVISVDAGAVGNISDTGLGEIVDQDPGPALSINDVSVDEDAVAAILTVSLSSASTVPVTVNFTTTDLTATDRLDYLGTALGGPITFAPGETQQQMIIQIIDDIFNEPDETFQVTLVGAINAELDDPVGIVTIVNDDPLPAVLISDDFVLEGEVAQFTVSLSSPIAEDVVLTIGTTDVTAVSPDDYIAASTQVTIPAGSLVATTTLDVQTNTDTVFEGSDSEAFTVNVISVDSGFLGNLGFGVGEIVDQSGEPTVNLLPLPAVIEGDTADYTLQLSGTSIEDIVVQVGTLPGTATSPDDYLGPPALVTIPAGSTTATYSVVTVDDLLEEPDENFSVALLNINSGAAVIGVNSTVTTIVDNDGPPTISISDASADEDAGTINFDVTLSNTFASPVSVNFTTADITATAGFDYVGLGAIGFVFFAPGETIQPASVQLIDDPFVEPDETFEVTLLNAVGGTILDGVAIGTILNDDLPPDVIIQDQTVNEGDTASFTIALSHATDEDITLTIGATDGSAVSPDDYDGPNAQVLIPAFSTVATSTFDVPTALDGTFEGAVPETFTVGVVTVDSGTVNSSSDTGLGQIIDIDAAPDLSLVPVADIPEDAGTVQVALQLSGLSSEDIVVTIGATDGTAVSPDDYSLPGTQVTISAGTLGATFPVSIVDDLLDEVDEDFTLSIDNVVGTVNSVGGPIEATILDNDDPPEISIDDVTVDEGDGLATFTLSLSAASSLPVSVDFATADGAAEDGLDYTGDGATLTFAPGVTIQQVSVPILEDPVDEPSEDFFVDLSNPLNATIVDPTGVGTITDNDDPPTISINDASALEIANAVVFNVILSAPSTQPIFVEFTTLDITATAGFDYVGLGAGGSVFFNPGETSKPANIFLIDDALDEPDETFEVNLFGAINAAILDSQGIGTIIDDEGTPSVIIGDQTVNEGDTASFTIGLSSPSSEDVVLTIGTADGTATSPDDYSGPDTQVTIPAGQTSTTFDVTTVIDNLFEGVIPETFTVGVVSVDAGTVGDTSDTGLGVIADLEAPPDISILPETPLPEDIGDADFTVQLSHASSEDITVTIGAADLTAISPDDYDFPGVQVTIFAGSLSEIFTVTINDDNLDEADEDFALSIDSIDAGTVGAVGAPITATILDNDDAPEISINDVTVNEGDGIASFTVSLTEPSGQTVSVNFASSEGSAVDGLDYLGNAGPLTFAPGQTVIQVDLPILEDIEDEPDETFFVTLSSPVHALLAAFTGTGTILDNDDPPVVSINDVFVDEGIGVADFEVTLSAPSAFAVTVDYNTFDVTAEDGFDYLGVTTSQLTFNPGETSKPLGIQILEDLIDEPGESFEVQLTGSSNASIGDGIGEGVILDNDDPPTVSIDDVTVDEGDGIASFAVSLSAPSAFPITVDYNTFDISAEDNFDYLGVTTSQLVFSPGETTKPLGIQILEDQIDEIDETFEVALVGASNATIADGQGIGTILDNDGPPTVSVDDAIFDEGVGTANFNVTLSAPSSLPVTVDFVTIEVTASDGFDYSGVSVPTQLVFNPGETAKSFGVQIIDDPLDEGDETFELHIVGATNATVADGVAIGTILDNDPTPNVIIGDATGNEGTTISFDVSLTSPSSQTTILTIGTTDGTAVSPDDYTGLDTQITIPAGSTTATATFDVALLEDALAEADETFTVGVVSVDAGTVADTSDTGLGTIVDLPDSFIIDNGDVGYSTTGNWTYIARNGKGHENDFELATPGGGIDTATWTFDLNEPGEYLVSVSYRQFSNRATNAPFTVFDGGLPLATVPVNQKVAANDTLDQGTWFEDLGTYSIFSNQLTVTLTDDADDFVIADAVRVQRLGDVVNAPEIQVSVNNSDVADDTGVVDLGNLSQGGLVIQPVDVANIGNQPLTLLEPISLPAGLSLFTSFGSLVLNPGESTSFNVQIDTSTPGPVGGEISFGNDDADENPFNFVLQANVDSAVIIDDGDPGFSSLGTFTTIANKGFQDDFRFANSGSGNNAATWTFSVSPGQYQVSATWVPFSNRATDAPFTIFDDGLPLATIPVNQQLPPAGIEDQDAFFTSLGNFNIFGTTLTVELDDSVSGLVVADAIRIERAGAVTPQPEIRVETGGDNVTDNTGVVDLGTAVVGDTVIQTFTVTNDGTLPLTLTEPISVPAGFSVASSFGSLSLNPGDSTTFDLELDTSVPASYSGQVSFGNNDADESPFNFDIEASVSTFAEFTAIVDNSDGAPDYTTVGPWQNINRKGHEGNFQYAFKGDGSTVARWEVDLPAPGTYRVSTTWRAFSNRVTDAPYTVFDGAVPLITIDLNQQLAPNDRFDGGTAFEDLGTFLISGNQIVVELSNDSSDPNPTHNLVIADAIRIERIGP